ncbi:MAG: ABC transporter permease [Candidatus Woesearchaeota archaeon]
MIYSTFKKSYAIAQLDLRKEKNKYNWILNLFLYFASVFAINKGIEFYTKQSVSINIYYGVVYYFIFSSGLIFGSELIQDWRNTIKILLSAPVKPIEILFGKTIFILRAALKFHYLLLLLILIVFNKINFMIIIKTFFIVLYYALTGVGIGLFLSTIAETETSKKIISFFNFFIMIFGGFFIKINIDNLYFKYITLLFPIIHVNNLFIYNEINLINVFMVILWFILAIIGAYQFNKNARK